MRRTRSSSTRRRGRARSAGSDSLRRASVRMRSRLGLLPRPRRLPLHSHLASLRRSKNLKTTGMSTLMVLRMLEPCPSNRRGYSSSRTRRLPPGLFWGRSEHAPQNDLIKDLINILKCRTTLLHTSLQWHNK